jgi:hypothetical protein
MSTFTRLCRTLGVPSESIPWKKEFSAMAKQPKNHRQPWTPAADKQLKQLAAGNTPTRVIGLKLGRTEDAVRNRASEKSVPLRPVNQSPYGTKKKR